VFLSRPATFQLALCDFLLFFALIDILSRHAQYSMTMGRGKIEKIFPG
jgi:hypothetical protein